MSAIAWIGRSCPVDVATLGGKGAGLAFLASHGVAIPPAFVVTASGYHEAVGPALRAEIESRMAALPEEASDSDLEAAAAAIRELIAEGTEGHPLQRQLRAAYEQLSEAADEHDLAVAVRSSSVAEDGASTSFAGEHDTYLWVTGHDEVDARVRDCWASLATTRALAYRRRLGSPAGQAGPAMAVVVQQMAPARSAGVFMTLNPINGDRSKILIESVWGLGEPLVSGEANPDRYLVDKITGEVVRRELADKHAEAVRDPVSRRGVVMQPVSEDRRRRPSLEPGEIEELVRVARLVEQAAGTPQDGEFAVVDGAGPANVRFLQCRAETAWSQRPAKVVSGRRSALEAVMATLTKNSDKPAV